MILSGKEILNRYDLGTIKIEPFDHKCINPNSYNVHLHDLLMVVVDEEMDMKEESTLLPLTIPSWGLVLLPGNIYLGRTVEYTETMGLVPMIEGRSSVGRLGMFIHITAGFGDVGFKGYWTLEIMVQKPLRIYPGVAIGQIYYHNIEGEYDEYSSEGKYQNNTGIQGSKLWREFK